MNNGHLDESNEYPFIGAIRHADELGDPTSESFCSAILITPAWALTSAHCFVGAYAIEGVIAEGSIDTRYEDVRITFNPYDLVDGFYEPSVPHTNAKSHQVLALQTTPINMASNGDKTRDLALVLLDERVSAVTPLHPPYLGDPSLASDSCAVFGSGFTATLVGYGPNSGGAYYNKGDSPGMGIRSYAPSDGWYRKLDGSGSLFQNGWFLPTALLGEYEGVNPGDSGGALLRDGILCGVNSAYLPGKQTRYLPNPIPFLPDIPYDVAVIYTDTAAVDSPIAQQFLANVLDADNRFMGECLPGEGPASKQNFDTDNDLIPDACDPCPHVPDPDYRFNRSFAVWPDGDDDGVPDVCDSCPTRKNGYDENHAQLDGDLDGVGDACDFCEDSDTTLLSDLTCCDTNSDCPGAYNVCFPVTTAPSSGGSCFAAGKAGRCAESPDGDDDAIGDYCDSCPATAQVGKYGNNNDSDHDGVGDVCDACPGLHPFGPQTLDQAATCTFDTTSNADDLPCITLTLNSMSRCNFNGRCTEGLDTDDDGVGNACDSCPDAKTSWQANCNLDTEIVSGTVSYPYIGDACDPNPCSYADLAYPEPQVDAAESGDIWNTVELDTELLPENETGAFHYSGTPTGTVGVRTCECRANPGETAAPTPRGCQLSCRLDSDEYGLPASRWKIPSVYHDTTPLAFEFLDPDDPATFDLDAEFELVPLRSPDDMDDLAHVLNDSAAFPLAWDVSRGNTLGVVSGAGAFNQSLRVVFWTHVKAVQGIESGADLAFRPWSNHYEASAFGKPGFDVSPHPNHIPFGPWSLWLEGCMNCGLGLDHPNWEVDPLDERLIIRGRSIAIDVSAQVAPGLLTELAASDRVRLTVAEGDLWIHDGSVRLASVSSDGTSVGVVVVVRDGWLQQAHPIDVVKLAHGEVAHDLVSRARSGTQPPAGAAPAPRTRFGAVLSARENALFVIGGLGANAQPTGDLWQYEPQTRTWFQRPLSGVRPNAVLAATIRPESRSLFVVDEYRLGWSRWARLLEVNLRSNTSRIVGAWPRHTAMDAVFLSSGPDGQLVLAGSSSARQRYVGVVFEPSRSSLLSIRAFFSGRGVLALRPTLDKRGLTLPLRTNTGVVNTFLSRDRLSRPGFGHHPGACL